jgi:HD-GYP domain-containing protein (c-di-GMP phosphodiesterase class II)
VRDKSMELIMECPQYFEEKFLLLQKISGAIAATNNINALSNIILNLATEYTNAEKGSLMLINERNELYIFAARGFDIRFIETYRIKMGEGIAGIIAQNRSPVLVEDIEKDERFKQKKRDRYKTMSFISCPLISRDKLLGVININDKKDGAPFNEDEFDLLKVIADQASVALENAFLMNQLRTKAIELEEMNRKLIEVDMNKTEFITRISHELRSPLNSIKGSIYYLQQSEMLRNDQQKEFYDIISKETTVLISIVENLLDFLRIENETMITKKSLINLATLLDEVSKSKGLNNALTKKNLQFTMDIKEGTYSIVGDKIKIVQLFLNLIEGLSYYFEGGDTIRLTVNENDFIKVDLTISRKIPEEVLSFLFNSKYIFYTEMAEERIRLYLAKRAMEAHRWTFDAKNTDNTFILSLTIPKSTKERLDTTVSITMDMFVEFVSELMDLNTCSIMLRDDITADLTIKSAKGLSEEIVKRTRIRLGDQIAGWVAHEGKPVLLENIESDNRFKRINIPRYNTKSLLSLPLKVDDRVIGVLNLNNKKTAEPFTKKDLNVALVLCERISYFLEKLYSGEYKEDDINQILISFENLLNAVKKYHKKKSILPDLVLKIMDNLRASEEEKRKALYASMIYDLGLVHIDESILKKKTLSASEIQDIKTHPYITIGLLENFEFSEDLKKAILYHHERYDGTGYPDGLHGQEIPLISRVLSVADSYCAMTSERIYGKSYTKDEALLEIKAGSGSIYDPEIVKAFEEVMPEVTTREVFFSV